MSVPAPPPVAKPRRRRTRLLVIPLLLLALGLLAFLVFYLRGTWATTQLYNPTTVEEGPVSQLHQTPEGYKVVRCAVVLPYPMERVWDVVTDYPHYSDFLPYLSEIEATRIPHQGVWDMKGKAKSVTSGDWLFEITVHQDKDDVPKRWRVWWEEKPNQGEVVLNRGSWELTPAGNNQTFLVLTLQAEVHSTPTFFLRNFFLYRLKQVVRAVEKRLQSQPTP